MIFGIFKISGHSMMPTLAPNDRIIVSSIPYFFSKPKTGDIVAFEYNGKIMVKRTVEVFNDSLKVEGDNASDSLKIKTVGKRKILGKIVMNFNM